MTDVVTFGEIMAMFVAAEHGPLDEVDEFRAGIAGAEMNVAVGLRRLGHQVRYFGAVGDDPFGRRAERTLRAEGVDVSGLVIDSAAPTGFQLKNRVAAGDPDVVYFRRGSAGSRYSWSSSRLAETVRTARHLHVTGVFPALSEETAELTRRAMETARDAGTSVSFDPNVRRTLWPDEQRMRRDLNSFAALSDWVLPGVDEGALLTGSSQPDEIADFYLERGVSDVIVKLGRDGATAYARGNRWYEPCVPVPVVDTVGAGDGFAAGWISARLDGAAERTALRRACAVGALATTSVGDMAGLPTRDALATVQAPISVGEE